jgi:CO/xanthine dehydrogenase Mo-binding subunit/CO/xanthine dehydrogenase FAD-binding subunit
MSTAESRISDDRKRDRFSGGRLGDVSGIAKTTGAAKYVGDLAFDELLEAGVVRSPHPFAEIRSIDVTAALAVPGVVAAVTSSDFLPINYKGAGGSLSDRPPMARGLVRYVGEEVVAIAANSAEALAQAISLVRIRYRTRRPVLTAEAAQSRSAPRLHQGTESGNIARRSSFTRGNGSEHPPGDEYAVHERYSTGSQAHCCLETHTIVALWPDEHGPVDLWTPTQAPLNIRRELAHVFNIAEQRIRLHDVAIGGDFGSRVKISTSEAIAVALARKARRPVRIRLTREEEFAFTKRRYPFDVALELRSRPDGTLTRLSADVTSDIGAYHQAGAGDFDYFPQALSSLYAIENISISSRAIYTNNSPPGSFRGAGGPQSTFARECALDELAAKLGIDPFEIRIRNLNKINAPAGGWALDNDLLVACLARARHEIGCDRAAATGGRRRGIGIAAAVHVTGVGELRAEAFVDLDQSGTITIRSASADPGTGHRTVLAQVAAHELGTDPSTIKVVLGESDSSPFDPGLGASKGSYVSTNAVGAAARDLADKLRSTAAVHFGVNEVSLEDGFARTARGDLSFGKLVPLSRDAQNGMLRGTGGFEAGRPVTSTDPSDGYSYIAQAADVEVDEDLGTVKVIKFVSVHDSGTLLNPILARAQAEGGIMMGIGAALGEEIIREGGRVANPSFTDYACARASDLPDLKVVLLDSNTGPGRYSSRGIAEICLVPTAAAVANAVADAIGARVRELPITPDKIIKARINATSDAKPRPIWTRPDRWWSALVRQLYPLGLHDLLHRCGPRRQALSGGGSVSLALPTRLQEALEAIAREPGARPLGGGTDLKAPTRRDLSGRRSTLVDVAANGELNAIRRTARGDLMVGGAVTLADLAQSTIVPIRSGIKETVLGIASRQIRNVATVAGNLCQEKRCWFYRNDFDCYKRSGPLRPCYAIEGDHRFFHAVMGAHRCQAVTPSDLATTLTALDAKVVIQSVRGQRNVQITDFYCGPGETILLEDEIVTDIVIPSDDLNKSTTFRKVSMSQGGFAVCSAAASVSLDSKGALETVRVVLGGIAPIPIRATAVERSLIFHVPTADRIRKASWVWVRDCHPLKHNGWKLTAASTLVARSIEAALSHARGRA